ncbi:MAG: twin-arginine translocase TatA/TatE family subunit [Alphaproteobacteria bacterium]|nr:twin-arginine translocase TatA/TatE family subunit [Alphaproteobacteria bacterium]
MGGFSIWHWLIVLAVILIIFGAGKLPRVMGDVAKGIKNFKQGMKEDDKPEEIVAQQPPATAANSAQSTQPGAAQKVS